MMTGFGLRSGFDREFGFRRLAMLRRTDHQAADPETQQIAGTEKPIGRRNHSLLAATQRRTSSYRLFLRSICFLERGVFVHSVRGKARPSFASVSVAVDCSITAYMSLFLSETAGLF